MPDPASPACLELPEEIAELREKVRLLTIQNNARATIIAGHQSMGWDRRAEDMARQQLDSQREANARLTDEVEQLQSRLSAAEAGREEAEKLADQRLDLMWGSLSPEERRWARMGFHEKHAALATERDAAIARVERLEKRVNAAMDDACRMSAILLMAGEMTAQERRTARAVANGLAAKVRSALSDPSLPDLKETRAGAE